MAFLLFAAVVCLPIAGLALVGLCRRSGQNGVAILLTKAVALLAAVAVIGVLIPVLTGYVGALMPVSGLLAAICAISLTGIALWLAYAEWPARSGDPEPPPAAEGRG